MSQPENLSQEETVSFLYELRKLIDKIKWLCLATFLISIINLGWNLAEVLKSIFS